MKWLREIRSWIWLKMYAKKIYKELEESDLSKPFFKEETIEKIRK
jgi:hypothetical protein